MAAEAAPDLESVTRKFRPALVAFFSRRVRSHAEAEDLTQEVFVRLAQSEVGALDSTEAFIFRIATNLLRDRARRDQVRTAYRLSIEQEDGLNADILDPHRVAAARETIGILWAAIQALPDPTQQIFILYRVENIQKQTIADNFGYNVRTVEKHISRALTFLTRRMKGRS
ncbi:sigma-70 family RNA polymerase sigma factor [Sphingopyxis sp. L1A2A]|uniref:RNA polymerase sigma factor n=1 Tax=Sphingopyxis sp. L1A2A TaxID=2502247 RepID=UPI0014853925|nr:sigma-70 family RNA polymerase sigma factor [Sphingopyxis sp. L1A2A]